MCKFKSAIVVEIGQMPPGYETGYDAGDTVYYHDGKGIEIGDYTLMMADNIIGWADKEGQDE